MRIARRAAIGSGVHRGIRIATACASIEVEWSSLREAGAGYWAQARTIRPVGAVRAAPAGASSRRGSRTSQATYGVGSWTELPRLSVTPEWASAMSQPAHRGLSGCAPLLGAHGGQGHGRDGWSESAGRNLRAPLPICRAAAEPPRPRIPKCPRSRTLCGPPTRHSALLQGPSCHIGSTEARWIGIGPEDRASWPGRMHRERGSCTRPRCPAGGLRGVAQALRRVAGSEGWMG